MQTKTDPVESPRAHDPFPGQAEVPQELEAIAAHALAIFGPGVRVEGCSDAEPEARSARVGVATRLPSLDLWTDTEPTDPKEPFVIFRMADCRNGYTESTATVVDDPKRWRRSRELRRKREGGARSDMNPDDAMRCAYRARKQIRLASKTIGADRLLTLTSRNYLASLDVAWLAFAEFNRLMRVRFGDRWQYVAVPEKHKSGMYHMHCAIPGHFPVDAVRMIWRKALRSMVANARVDHTPGNIDIKYRERSPFSRVSAVAAYIAKYVVKQFDQGEMHRKRYEKSRGSSPVIVTKYLPLGLFHDLSAIRLAQMLSSGVLARVPAWVVAGGRDVMLIETEPPDV